MSDTPVLDALFDEVQTLRDRAEGAERRLAEAVATYENLRPHWAKGYSSDSSAAQAATSALLQLWDLLHVKDQTAAVQKVKELKAMTDWRDRP